MFLVCVHGQSHGGSFSRGIFVNTDGEVGVLLRSAVALGGEELDVWLGWRKVHGVATGTALRVAPEWLVFQTLVETREREGAEREAGQEADLFLLVHHVRVGECVAMVDHVVVGKAIFLCLVKYED